MADGEKENKRLTRALYQTASALSTAIELRDPYTFQHQTGVATLSRAIGQRLKLSTDRMHALRIAATLHDVGKIAVPSEILNSPRRLNEQETAIVRLHASAGYDILKRIDFPWPVAEIVRQHHERMDGSGYPDGLAGDGIHLEARIIAVADTIDAMLVARPYRRALPLARVVAELEEYAGITLDAEFSAIGIELLTRQRRVLTSFAPAVQRQPVVRAILDSD